MINKKGNIGIIGGMGPLAGLDLSVRIVENTLAKNDQEHINQILFSQSANIPDRTDYLHGKIDINPGVRIADLLCLLEKTDCYLAGIACNTAHADKILGVVLKEIAKRKLKIKLLNIIEETGKYIKNHFPETKRAGIIGTNGTVRFKVYDSLIKSGIKTLYPSSDNQKLVHESIYHPRFGIKSIANGKSQIAQKNLSYVFDKFAEMKADIIILACTEVPMVFPHPFHKDLPLINPNEILARALIREHSPEKLKPTSISTY